MIVILIDNIQKYKLLRVATILLLININATLVNILLLKYFYFLMYTSLL